MAKLQKRFLYLGSILSPLLNKKQKREEKK
jgi:hypothetical protein